MRVKNCFPSFSVIVLFFVFGFSSFEVRAQDETETMGVETRASQTTATAGQELILTIKLKLSEGMHANSDTPKDPNLIATIFTPEKAENIIWNDAKYPPPSQVNEWYSNEPLSVFEDGAEITIPLKIAPTATAGKLRIGGKLRIQACDHDKCYPTKRIPAYVEITVIDKD